MLKFDEQNRFETPSRFDYNTLVNRVNTFVKDLEKQFEVLFKIDDQIQDASFYCDIIIPKELVKIPKPNLGYAIRVSNFGGLVTINFQDEYATETLLTIQNILEQHNFIFIGGDDLDEEYDGQFQEFKNLLGGEIPTWYIRYFDYL